MLLFELEDAVHEEPFLAGFGLGRRLLELPHQSLPLADSGIGGVGLGLSCEGKFSVHFHDHEEARAEEIDFHVLDAGVADAAGDFRPDFLVIAAVFGDELRVVLQVQGEAVAGGHGT